MTDIDKRNNVGFGDAEFIAALKRSDTRAWETLYRQVHGELYGFLRKKLAHRHEDFIEDCIQEAFVRAYAGEEAEKRRPAEAVSGKVFDRLLQDNFVILSTVMARKECFDAVGPFDLSIPAGLDYDMWVRISQHYEFAYIGEPLIKYRIHLNNLGRNFKLQIRGQEAFFNKYKAYTGVPGKPNSVRYFKLGLLYGFTHDLKTARRIYLKSIRLYPLNPKPYVAFFMTFLGQRGYMAMLERIVK